MVKVYFRTVTSQSQTYGKGYFVYSNSQRSNDQEIVYHTDLKEFVYKDSNTQIDLSKGARGTLHFVVGGSPANAVPVRSIFNIEMVDPVGDLRTTAKEGSESCRPGQLGLTNKPGIWLEWPSIGDAAPSWWEEKPGGSSNEGSQPKPPSGDSEGPPPQPTWPFPLSANNNDFIQLLIWLYNLGKRDFPFSYLLKVDLSKANLSGIDLSFSYLCGANLAATNLCAANLAYAYLCDAYLGHANLSYSYLGYANFCGADLTNADLRGSDITGANFTNANLTGAKLDDAQKQLLGIA